MCVLLLFINFFIGELLGVDYLLSQTGEPLVVDPDSEETENMLEDVDEGGDEEDEGFGEDQTHDIAVSSLNDDPIVLCLLPFYCPPLRLSHPPRLPCPLWPSLLPSSTFCCCLLHLCCLPPSSRPAAYL